MAATTFAFGDSRAQTVWSKKLFQYALENMRMTALMGKSKGSVINVDRDLTTRPGGTIVFQSRNPLSGAGQGDNGDTTGNEESLQFRNMNVAVHERMHSTLAGSKINLQLTNTYKAEGFRQTSKEALGEWLTEVLENDLVTCACGLYNENSSSADIETINESYPESDRIYYGGQSVGASPALDNSGVTHDDDAALTADTSANNRFGTLVISHIKTKAVTSSPRFRPAVFRQETGDDIRVNVQQGRTIGRFLVVLASPFQINDMRQEIGTGGWNDIVKAAAARGNLHPVFTAGNALWNGCIIVEYDRTPYRTGAGGTTLAEGFLLNAGRTATTDACANGRSVARALMLGAQAMAFGWAQEPEWGEDMYDVNRPKIKTDMLYGVKKFKFNAHVTSTPGSEEAIYAIDTEIEV